MKKFLLATSARLVTAVGPLAAIVIIASAQPARAADQSAAPHLPTKSAIVPPAPIYSWSGCYIGAQGGGGAVSDTFVNTSFDGNNNFLHGGGAFAGGQLGCNYQRGNFVFGLEGEVWSGLTNPLYFTSPGDAQNIFTRNRWNADVAVPPPSPSTARSSTARPASPRAVSPSPRRTYTVPSQRAPAH